MYKNANSSNGHMHIYASVMHGVDHEKYACCKVTGLLWLLTNISAENRYMLKITYFCIRGYISAAFLRDFQHNSELIILSPH